ncbi:sensor histidine kinase [Streptomyces sp. TLI_171]|uniref:sensor histidine kinase n=1 Tax=Streptomyces sp. TLI_171 TaxID=1938859 RepID=UPI000C5D1F19|nr:histidine kinase [Streptomyces sp. TLI_171]RKE21262.1 two-component system sensor histidine kinase DesK [Streptomyces sp. TLI_171]
MASWPAPDPEGKQLAPKTAVTITALVFLGYTGVATSYVLALKPGGLLLAGTIALLALLLGIQLVHSFPRLAPALAKRWPLTLVLQAAITYAPFFVLGPLWIGMPSFLAASLLLLLRPVVAWPGFAAVVVVSNLLMMWIGDTAGETFYISVATITNGLVIYGLSRLTDLVIEVHRSRAELATLAVAQERLRFARDLHDLLGYSLSAITLKCELAYRLVPTQHELAQQELTEILQTARQALADVRAVARGYREMSLTAEAESAKAMLTTLGVHSTVRLDFGLLPQQVETVLATVLREGLTNMLRHSKVEQCEISAVRDGRTIRFRLANDGVGRGAQESADRKRDDTGGSGLGNLTTRVRELGGTLTAGPYTGGWFVVEAAIDLDTATLALSGSTAGGRAPAAVPAAGAAV